MRLPEAFIKSHREIPVDWGPIGYAVYKRTYARPGEEYPDTCRRVVEGTFDWLREFRPPNYNPLKEMRAAQDMYRRNFDMKWLPPGRGMWSMGTDLIKQRGSAYLNNCCFVSTEDSLVSAVTYAMDMLMCGIGVGFDTSGAGGTYIYDGHVSTSHYYHTVQDSKEGWCESACRLLSYYTNIGLAKPIFRFDLIRDEGMPLLTSGGIAPGPKPLIQLLRQIDAICLEYAGRVIDSTFIVRLFFLVGSCVVAGNLRRSALLGLGSGDDEAFIHLKDNKDDLGRYSLWASNNSIRAYPGYDYGKIIPGLLNGGDPGIIWPNNISRYGRMGELKPDTAIGVNPCGEATLESRELCCLAETFPARHSSLHDFLRTLKQAYTYAKVVSLIPVHDPGTQAVVSRNHRIGISISGIQQAIARHGRNRFKWWLDEGYRYLAALDRDYSDWLGVPESIRLTTCKPSGSISTLPGATSGLRKHAGEFMIKRLRIATSKDMWRRYQEAGYKVEPDVHQANTMVVDIPLKPRHFTGSKYSLWDQAKDAAMMARCWADQAVSVTLSFTEEEAEQLPAVLKYCETRLKTVSLMPKDTTHYEQMPEEEITLGKFLNMIDGLKEVNLHGEHKDSEERFCQGDKCQIDFTS